MGIPYYFSYLIQNYKNIILDLKNIDNSKFEYLFIDSNSIIYDSINFNNYENDTQFENQLINIIIKKLEELIKIYKPKKYTFITFDGVPPFAKINQQKNRRYKSSYQNSLFNKLTPWDTCAITPGTKFMDKLNKKITQHFSKNKNILLSLSDKPGEGEHKLFNYIRNNKCDNSVIYGMDADLIMLSLNHLKYCENIYLFRETPTFIKSLDASLNPDENYLLNISQLGKQIYKLLSDDVTIKDDTPCWLKEASNILDNSDNVIGTNFYKKIEDYIFICFLLGNDFMPHFPALNIRINGFNILFDLYKELFNNDKTIVNDGEIIWKNFRLYIEKLALQEENFIKQIYNVRNKQSKRHYPDNTEKEKENKFNALPILERNKEMFINPYEKFWEYRYYYSLFDVNIDINETFISSLCYNFLETLQWTYYYYTKDCVNWSHYYKYDYPPLLCDLYKNIPYFNSEINLIENKTIIHPYLLLSHVLPKKSLSLLPDNIHKYLLNNYENHYKEDYEFNYSFCKYFWEAHVKFPELNIQEFSNNINNLIKT